MLPFQPVLAFPANKHPNTIHMDGYPTLSERKVKTNLGKQDGKACLFAKLPDAMPGYRRKRKASDDSNIDDKRPSQLIE
jgi:hypothetical protein